MAAPAAGEAELPEFPGRAMVVVDRFVHGVSVDLAGAIAIHRHCDLGKQSGQLRLVVSAHPFAGGPPFSFGAHDLGRYRVMADPARGDGRLGNEYPPRRTLVVVAAAGVAGAEAGCWAGSWLPGAG